MKHAGAAILIALVLAAAAAPWLSPSPPERRYPQLLYAPPSRVHVFGAAGLQSPFIHPLRVVSRLERRFEEDRTREVRLRWFTGEAFVAGDSSGAAPLLLLGADAFGRDIFSRLVHGARLTLALAILAALIAVIVGAVVGGIAGYAGGWLDDVLSRASEFVLVLPTIYVVLALRGALPLTLSTAQVFAMLTATFAFLGWPIVARGVRGIVAAERQREYIAAAQAIGVPPARVLLVHLMPAALGHIAVQLTLLLPSFILAEATMSYVGLGFPDAAPTWGTMLQDAGNISLVADAPWMLAPAVAIFLTVLAVNLLVQGTGRPPVQLER